MPNRERANKFVDEIGRGTDYLWRQVRSQKLVRVIQET
jgi:hypothetical protein